MSKTLPENVALEKASQTAFSKAMKSIKGLIKKGDVSVKDKASFSRTSDCGAVYLSHIPHGFYEVQMKKFFSQFGYVTRLKLARSKKTGNSKGYAFIEFRHKEVAQIVAETMNNYLMFTKLVKAKYIPPAEVSEAMFFGRKFTPENCPGVEARKRERKLSNRPLSASQVVRKYRRARGKLSSMKEKLTALGVNYTIQVEDSLNLDVDVTNEEVTPANKSPLKTQPKRQTPVRAEVKSPLAKSPKTQTPVKTPAKSPLAQKSPMKSPLAQKTPIKTPLAQKSPIKSPLIQKTPITSPLVQKSPLTQKPAVKTPVSQQVTSKSPVLSSKKSPKAEKRLSNSPIIEQPPIKSPKMEKTAKSPKMEQPTKSPKMEKPAKSPKMEQPTKSPKMEKPTKSPKLEQPTKSPKVETKSPTLEKPTKALKVEKPSKASGKTVKAARSPFKTPSPRKTRSGKIISKKTPPAPKSPAAEKPPVAVVEKQTKSRKSVQPSLDVPVRKSMRRSVAK